MALTLTLTPTIPKSQGCLLYQNTEEVLHYVDNEGRDWSLEEMVQAIEALQVIKGKMQMSKTSTQRMAKLRAWRKADGWTILHCHLPPDVAAILANAALDAGMTKTEAVIEALRSWARLGLDD